MNPGAIQTSEEGASPKTGSTDCSRRSNFNSIHSPSKTDRPLQVMADLIYAQVTHSTKSVNLPNAA
jgi:hypothetical protein